MQELAKHIPDVTTFAANIVVFFAAIGAAVAGGLSMLKKIKTEVSETFKPVGAPSGPGGGDIVTQQRMIGTLMLETTTAAMLTEAQRQLAEATDRLIDVTRDNREATCDLTREVREVRHQLERLTDRMK